MLKPKKVKMHRAARMRTKTYNTPTEPGIYDNTTTQRRELWVSDGHGDVYLAHSTRFDDMDDPVYRPRTFEDF